MIGWAMVHLAHPAKPALSIATLIYLHSIIRYVECVNLYTAWLKVAQNLVTIMLCTFTEANYRVIVTSKLNFMVVLSWDIITIGRSYRISALQFTTVVWLVHMYV